MLDLLAEPLETARHASDAARSIRRRRRRAGSRFRGVSFHYPGSEQLVLQDIDLDVEPGEMIALVGRSGARQDDALQPGRPVLRPDRRADPARRQSTCAKFRSSQLPPPAGHRRAGRLPVRRHDRREHRLRPPRSDFPGRDRARRPRPPTPTSSSPVRAGLRHPDRRARRAAQRRPAAAAGDRPGRAGRTRGSSSSTRRPATSTAKASG